MSSDPDVCDGTTCAEASAVVVHREGFDGEHRTSNAPCDCQPVVFCSGCGGRKPSTTPTRNSSTWWLTE